MSTTAIRRATVATFAIFALNGLVFASWASRIPAVAIRLHLSDGQMGILLLTIAAGSVLALPLAGMVVARLGTARTVACGGMLAATGAVVVSFALLAGLVPVTAVGLFFFGMGIGLWDVSQNIEGADVERHLGRTLMPKFHAGFSGGAFAGAVLGAVFSSLNVSLTVHLLSVAVLVAVSMVVLPRWFLPMVPQSAVLQSTVPQQSGGASAAEPKIARVRSAWTESRTLMVGLVVLGAALTEGAANDWIAKSTVDGMGGTESQGAVLFAVFVASMTCMRFFGGRFIDSFGRVAVLYASLGAALAGLLVFVFAPTIWLMALGAVLWGAGAAMGFPMGMSAAADHPARAAARVSVVSTIGYVAFLAGPPLLGFLGDHFTIRRALLAVGVVIVASLLTARAARPLPGSRAARQTESRMERQTGKRPQQRTAQQAERHGGHDGGNGGRQAQEPALERTESSHRTTPERTHDHP